MKKITCILTVALFAASTYAQDSSSSSSPKNNANNTRNNSGGNRWSDTGYYRRNRPTYDSLLRVNRGRWNEDSSYYITSAGDTMRQYGRSEWMRDSINFENRNWDSSWQGRDKWENEMNQSGQYNSGTDSTKSQMNSTSGSMNRNSDSSNSKSMNSGTMSNRTDSAGRNTSGRTTDRKTIHGSQPSDVNTPALSGAGDTQSPTSKAGKDRVYMKNNTLMVSKNGVSTKVSKSITLKDGTIVSANGTVKLPDGTTMKLKNGESISLGEKSSKSSSSKQ